MPSFALGGGRRDIRLHPVRPAVGGVTRGTATKEGRRPTGVYGPVLVSGPPARPRSAVAAGAAAAPRPAAPDGSKPPFLPRDYEKGVVDGRARAFRGSGPRPVRARLGPSRPPLAHGVGRRGLRRVRPGRRLAHTRLGPPEPQS